MSTYPTWEPGVAWIYGYVDTDSPGHRTCVVDGNETTVSAGYYDFPSFWLEAYGQIGLSLEDDTRLITSVDCSTSLYASDRLLWLLGFGLEPGETFYQGDHPVSIMPSPAAVPLQACDPMQVPRQQERVFKLDRFGRGHGQIYGGADLWRFRLRMDRPAMLAFTTGWCMSGRVIVSPFTLGQHIGGEAFAWSKDQPNGFVAGRVFGIENASWLDGSVRATYECDFLVSTGVS